jgi:hypothetical protein
MTVNVRRAAQRPALPEDFMAATCAAAFAEAVE